MADVTIPNLPAVAGLAGDELIELVQPGNAGGVSKRASLTQVVSLAGVPSSRQIIAGTGLSGGGPLTSDVTLSIANINPTTGTFGSSSSVIKVTANSQGQITTLVNTPIVLSASSNIQSGTLQVARGGTGLATSPVAGQLLIGTSGSGYALGALAAGGNITITTGDGTIVITGDSGTPSSRTITAGAFLSGGGDLSQDRTIALAFTGVAPGAYGSGSSIPVFTVNSGGQITTAQNAPVSGFVPTTRQIVAGAFLSGGGDLSADRTVALAFTGVTTGAIGSASSVAVITLNSGGQATSVGNAPIVLSASSNIQSGTLPVARGGTGLATSPTAGRLLIGTSASGWAIGALGAGGNITITTGDGTISIAGSSGVPASRTITAGAFLSGGGDLSADRTIALAFTGVTTGVFGSGSSIPVFTVNSGGQITTAQNVAVSGFVPTSRQIVAGASLSGGGDLSADRTLALAFTGVTTGVFGSGSSVAQVTHNSGGQATSVSNIPIVLSAASNIQSGTLPIARGGTGLASSPVAGQLLIGTSASGYALGALAAGANITITTGDGTISIAGAGSTGINTVNAGFSISGGGSTSTVGIALAFTGVVTGTLGSASTVPVVTFNSGGQATSVASAPIVLSATSNIQSGTLSTARGGTGVATAPHAGQLLVGTSGSGWAVSQLTAGTNISITSGDGTITVNNTGGTAGMTLLATYTATSSAIDTTSSGFNATYDNYLLLMQGVQVNANAAIKLQVYTSGSIDSGTNYNLIAYDYSVGSAGIITADERIAATAFEISDTGTVTSTGTDSHSVFGCDFLLLDVNGSNYKTAFTRSTFKQPGVVMTTVMSTAMYVGTGVIQGAKVTTSTGSFVAGKLKVYGYQN